MTTEAAADGADRTDGPEAPETVATRRGRPRSAAADGAIIEAVLRLIEGGENLDGLSMERIARTAGVGKATAYRRWPGKDALLLDVMRTLDDHGPAPRGLSVRDDLIEILEWLRRPGLAKRSSAVLRTVLSHFKSHPDLWRQYHDTVIRPRRETLHDVLRRGVAAGELRDDIDVELLGELFVGPMLSWAMLHEWPELPAGLAEQIVDGVLDGARPRR
jgi:AcrR family transcriptional regulator